MKIGDLDSKILEVYHFSEFVVRNYTNTSIQITKKVAAIVGPLQHVAEVEAILAKTISNFKQNTQSKERMSNTFRLLCSAAQFLNQIQKILHSKGLTAVMQVSTDKITMYAINQSEAREALVTLDDKVEEFALKCPRESMAMLKKSEWKTKLDRLKKKWNQCIEVSVAQDIQEIRIACIKEALEETVAMIKQATWKTVLKYKRLDIPESKAKVLQSAFHNEIADIESRCTEKYVWILFENKAVYVFGNEDAISVVEGKVNQLVGYIAKQVFTIPTDIQKKYLASRAGFQYKESEEIRKRVAIDITDYIDTGNQLPTGSMSL